MTDGKKRVFSRMYTNILIIILLAGFVLLLYPTVSNWWNERVQTRAIATYDDSISDLSDTEYEQILEEAVNYNERLLAIGISAFYTPDMLDGYTNTSGEVLNYEDILDITGTGIMGYVSIPKISVQLPIYHGTSNDVLQVAAGHLEGTSLPVGGEGTHAVIMAHRGLPSARLFTDINELEVGDTFTITVLRSVLTYEVDLISIVEPSDVSELQITEGEDYVTLMTCTPYGVNSHRLLVRGHRVETADDTVVTVSGEASRIRPLLVAAVIDGMLLVILLIATFLWPGKKKE